jgi:hypothetical protein
MKTPETPHRAVSWNGVSISVPQDWEAKVTDKCRMNFECNFEAVLEISWQKAPPKDIDDFAAQSKQRYEQLSGAKLMKYTLPLHAEQSLSPCTPQCFATKEKKIPRLLFLFEKESALFITILLFQTQHTPPPWDTIATIAASPLDKNGYQLWAVQDFHITVPSTYQLSNYSMAAGFTTLHFKKNTTTLHICRLAPASVRLRDNSLDDICTSLLGIHDTSGLTRHVIDKTLYCERSPGLGSQVLMRLKRKNPFLLASLRHDNDNDRLLGVFMEGVHPLDHNIHNRIFSSYETFPAKKSTPNPTGK